MNTGAFDDNYQKLFRTGEKSAAAIAGAVAVGGFALNYELPALLRGEPEFQWRPGQDFEQPPDVYAGLNVRLEVLVQRVAAIDSLYGWSSHGPILVAALVAGIEADGTRYIRRVDLIRRTDIHAGWGLFPRIEASARDAKGAAFDWERAGPTNIESFVDAVLGGTVVPVGDIFRRYAAARAEGREDAMPIEDLKTLALSIMELAKQQSRSVGGRTQVGVFPVVGQAEWLQQEFPPQQSAVIGRSSFSIGEVLDGSGQRPRRQPAMEDMFDDFNEPLNVPFARYYLGGDFRNLTFVLDKAAIYGNRFRDVRFIYRGGLVCADLNHFKRCELLTSAPNLPDSLESLRQHCRVLVMRPTPPP